MTFSEFGLHETLLRGVEDLGFSQPTPIQRDSIPPAMEGRDVLACAMTGSGKSAAFLLPVMQRLLPQRRGVTRVLVLTPTRELAAQIDEHRAELGKHTRITGAAVFGGVGMKPQERAFRTGVDILVATPGRLLDHFQYDYAKLNDIEILIIDEADRMLDMGFLPDIRRVFSHLPRKRQTLFFSATMPGPIVQLSREILHDPVTLNIERQSAPATGITHAVYPVPQTLKSPLLLHLLESGEMQSVVVFTRTKHRANRLAEYLKKHGVSCGHIHGNRSQSQRTEALSSFKKGDYRVLVATDIAARGIDVEALSHVVNFDVPHVSEDYIHRVGRTARAEATGDAFTFMSPEEEGDLRAIEKALGKQIPRRQVEGFDRTKVEEAHPETPRGERIAQIRAMKAEERARAAAKAARRAEVEAGRSPGSSLPRPPLQPSAPRRNDVRRTDGGRRDGGRPLDGRPNDSRPSDGRRSEPRPVEARGTDSRGNDNRGNYRSNDSRPSDSRPNDGNRGRGPGDNRPGPSPSFRPVRGS